MRNVECGMRNRLGRFDPRRPPFGSTRARSIPHSTFRTPHFMHSALRIPHWGRAGLMGFPHKPHARETVLLSRYFGEADARTYKGWVKRGGFAAVGQAGAIGTPRGLAIVEEWGLAGRRGARVSSGGKWPF